MRVHAGERQLRRKWFCERTRNIQSVHSACAMGQMRQSDANWEMSKWRIWVRRQSKYVRPESHWKRGLLCRTLCPGLLGHRWWWGPDEETIGPLFAQCCPIWLLFWNALYCHHAFASLSAYYPKNKSKPEKEITRTLSICDMCVLCLPSGAAAVDGPSTAVADRRPSRRGRQFWART